MTGRLGFCIHARLEALVVGRVSRVGRMIRQHASMEGSVAAVYDLMDSAHIPAPTWATTCSRGRPYRPALDSLGR
jgi:hypothetical protein